MAQSRCCEGCCCCRHGGANLVSVMIQVGLWMLSAGIITCIFGFTALADAKDVDVFKVCAMLLCALGVPTSMGAFYVSRRVRTLAEGDDVDYLKTRDALFDVFVCTGALLIMLGFLFMVVGFAVESTSVVLRYFGVIGCIQFVFGMLDLVFIRVWVRGSQPRTGRGNIIDVLLDLRYPLLAFEDARCAAGTEPPARAEPETYEQEPGVVVIIEGEEDLVAVSGVGGATGASDGQGIPAAPPTYEDAVNGGPANPSSQCEPPPAYEFSTSSQD